MNGSGKNASKHYPKIGCGAKEDAHNGSEDGAGTGNVEELDEEDSPCWHGNEIDSVLLGVAGHLSCTAGLNDTLNDCAVKQIAQQEAN